MSAATKRKHVEKEVLGDFVIPEDHQQIVKISGSRGNNLHEVITADGQTYLVSMPTKFRKHVWIKRGDYVIVDPICEGDRVKGEIVNILYKDQIKYIKSEGKWPSGFNDEACAVDSASMIPVDMLPPSDTDSDTEDSLGDKVIHTNRPSLCYQELESDAESSEEEIE